MARSLVSLVLLGSFALACSDDGPATTSSSTGESESPEPSESETAGPGESETGDDPLTPICDAELSETVTAEGIAAHLVALADIAAEHDGNRSAGSSGYAASAEYVEAQLHAAGYETTRWPFTFDRYVLLGPAQLALLSEPMAVYVETVDYAVPNWSPSGSVSAALEPVDLQLGLENTSSSACEPEDFAGFTPGNIALIQRGSCTFITKAQNAEAAGAVGVVLFNQGDSEDRLGLFGGSLGSQNTLTIPVLFATYAVGDQLALAAAMQATIIEITVDSGALPTDTFNVFAQTPTGDPNHVIMLGAHLDSVPAGPGVNDNGSGSATLIELARHAAACSPHNAVRFAWWGGEEWGLKGSRAWVEALDDVELASLALYLNFDMVASPNYVRYVHDGVGGPEGSVELHAAFVEWFDAQGLPTVGAGFAGNSDYQPFVDAGVPSSGLATGAGGAKTQDQADTYGGTVGAAYDACYHQACDGQDNFAADVLEQNARAAAHVLQKYATALGSLGASPNIVTVPSDVATATVHECGYDHE